MRFSPISAEFLVNRKADILTFGVKMRSWHKNNIRIGIIVVKLLLKEVSHKFLGGLVQKLDFPRFWWRPFWKRVNIWKCSRDMTWHPPESLRAIPRLQETVEKKTLSSKTRFTQNHEFGPRTNAYLRALLPGVILTIDFLKFFKKATKKHTIPVTGSSN